MFFCKKAISMSNIKGKVEFITAMIDAFAQQNSLNKQQAYRYIRRFRGIDFLVQHYEAIRTLDFKEALSYLTLYCQRQGGAIA